MGYVKVGINKETKILLEQEENTLKYVKSLNLKYALIPEIIDKGKLEGDIIYLALRAKHEPLEKSYELTEAHVRYIREIYEKTGRREIFRETELYKLLVDRIKFLENKIPYYWILNYLRVLKYYEDKFIPIYLSHGDFTPWNVSLKSGKLFLYDWEYSRWNVFMADFFHFVISKHIFSKKISMNKKTPLFQIKMLMEKSSIDSNFNFYDFLLLFLAHLALL